MLTVSKGKRRVGAMVLNVPVNEVRGIVQCLVPGCEAHIVMMGDTRDPAAFIDDFLRTHDCDSKRFARKR